MQKIQYITTPDVAPPPIPRPKRPQYRIKAAGTAVMEEFLLNHPSADPTLQERKELLTKICALPGCEDYTLVKLSQWFQRRRRSSGSIDLSANHWRKSITEEREEHITTSPYSSLTERSIQKLKVLCQGNSFPSAELVQTWAELLGAQKHDVIAWLHSETHLRSPITHLPTPISTSPEPSPSDYGEYFKHEPLYSPTVPLFSPRPIPQTIHEPRPLPRPLLLKAIAEAASAPRRSIESPSTSNDFEQLFNPYIKRIETIIQRTSECYSYHPPNT